MTKSRNFKHAALGAMLTASLTVATSYSHSVQAETKGYTNYVTDSISVPVRRGAGYKFKISQMLKSGTPVQILKVDDEGWANIEYTRGSKTHQGWMPTSMLQNKPIASVRLADQIEKTNQVEDKFNSIKQELDTLKERHEVASSELASIKQEKFEISQELDRLKTISSNAVALDQENQQMKMRLTEVENANAIMREQIDQSDDVIKRQWFLTGAGVLLFGLLVGRFFRPPAKRSWGQLQ